MELPPPEVQERAPFKVFGQVRIDKHLHNLLMIDGVTGKSFTKFRKMILELK